jgi:hypothetical protein
MGYLTAGSGNRSFLEAILKTISAHDFCFQCEIYAEGGSSPHTGPVDQGHNGKYSAALNGVKLRRKDGSRSIRLFGTEQAAIKAILAAIIRQASDA